MEPNTRLGNYTLEQRLGSGAMADVFMAMQTSVDRTVAIKVMHAHLSHTEDFGARFQREARAMGRLRHPHIARVIDFDSTGPNPYMVIEYLQGGSLHDLLNERAGPLAIDEAVTITRQLADALQYAHGMGMVHRDIKPANVMFVDRERQHAVLTDFGIARLADDSMTATGTILGTASYIAPEQVRGERAGPASDQYSLGVMLFEMVTGTVPFAADSPHALLMKHVSDPVPSAAARNPAVPPALDEIIGRSLAKRPEDRFPDAGAMGRVLDQVAVAGGSPSVPRGATVVVTPGSAGQGDAAAAGVAKPARGKQLAAAAAGLVLVAAVVFGLTQALGDGDDPVETVTATATEPDADGTGEAADIEDEPSEPAEPPAGEAAPPALEVEAEAEAPAQPENATVGPGFDPDNPPALFVTNAAIVDDTMIVGFDRARQPAAGTTYVAWIDGVDGSVGEIRVDGRGTARLEFAQPDPGSAVSFFVTEETTGAAPQAPAGAVVLTAGVDQAGQDATTALLDALDAADRELSLARDHDLLMQESIAADDLTEVRRHAEHVVNILDGADGDTFGDLDGSGLAENPGDDIGVRGHLDALATVLTEQLPDSELVALRVRLADQISDSERAFLRVLAADAISEIASDAGTQQLNAVALDLAAARTLVQRQWAINLVSDLPVKRGEVGSVWLAPTGDAVVRLRGALLSAHLVQVGVGPDATVLGELDELGTVIVDLDLQQFGQLESLVVTSGPDASGSTVIARAVVPAAALAVVDPNLGNDGTLALLEAQAQLVIDHIDLMQREIDSGTLAELRRHAEHVVNLVEGAAGEHFGDLDGSGLVENPGDEVGVLARLDELRAAGEALPADTDEQIFYRSIWLRAVDATRSHAVEAADQALRALATDSLAEAQPLVAEAFAAGVSLLDGHDADENGVIDLFAGELGVRGLGDQAPTLVVAPLIGEPT